MSIFDFFRHKHETEDNRSAILELENRYLVEDADDYWVPMGRPKKGYKITDKANGHKFLLNINYDIFSISDLEGEEAEYYGIEDDSCKVSVRVSTNKGRTLAFFSSEILQKNFDVKEKRISINDANLALYNQLKEARQDSSNPQKQEEAYLVSTLLQVAHDDIWIAPLLQCKDKPEDLTELEQSQLDVNKAETQDEPKVPEKGLKKYPSGSSWVKRLANQSKLLFNRLLGRDGRK